jgi:error-prone DNA polymerase
VIGKLGLAGYFLIVWDIVQFCRRRGILAQGRGSAANSAVCYVLGITAVDPVKMKLLFERFLSEERGEWPDIDLDLPSGDAREEVIQYVYRKYGRERVAMVANVITYRPKMAVRDVGRALGFAEADLGKMSRLLEGWGYQDARDSIERQIAQAGFTVADERTRLLVELSARLVGLPRHLGQHSGGMVIARGRLDEVVPLEPASMPGRVVIQWDKEDCADLGIIKIDLLGLGMLAALAEAVELVRAHEDVDVDLAHLPPDDPAIYDMLCRADTVGLFQVESRAQMATLPRLRPRCFYDIVIEVAIIRPGPIVGDLLHPYLRRRMGREEADPMHPSLKEVLDRTLGVPLFQEQLMRVAMIAAGFTGGEAEELRRAMGFKRSEERMDKIAERLRTGMAQRGIVGEAAERIVRAITAFAAYGFPESHAASFALIVYASAYLKAHHSAAFYAAILNNYPMGFYHPSTLVRDALRHGVTILPIDVQRSDWRCTLEEAETPGETGSSLALRIGLCYVRSLGEAAGERIVRARAAAGGRFSSVEELAARADVGRDFLVQLAELGALVEVGPAPAQERDPADPAPRTSQRSRRSALWQVESIGRSGPLFVRGPAEGGEAPPPSPLAEMSPAETLAADFRIAGLSTGPHPMALRRAELERASVLPTAALAKIETRRRVRVAGHVIVRQRPGTAKGFFFLTLEDETGLANIIVGPRHFDAHRPLLVGAGALIVEGILQREVDTVSIKADRFWRLEDMATPSRDFH